MIESAAMLPAVAVVLVVVLPIAAVLLLLGCMQCLFPKKRGFSNLQDTAELSAHQAQSNAAFAAEHGDVESLDTAITIEPLPETLGASPLAPLTPLRPRITCLERGRLDSSLELITVHHPFSRSQILYLKEIGYGWFGQVIESDAEKIISGASRSRVVVKQLKDDATKSEQTMFLEDVAVYRELEHPNVLRLLGQCTETQPYIMILEYLALGDLKSYLRSHRNETDSMIKKNRLLKFALDAASGLACLHRHNYAHHDFSARNCMVSADFGVKVGDYGISEETFREDYFHTGRELLPIRWMAPESVSLENNIWCALAPTKEADIWAFGVMLWEIVSLGQQPYQEMQDEAVLKSVIADKLVKLTMPTIALLQSDRVFEVMQFCWLEPQQRLSIEEVHGLLQHLLTVATEAAVKDAPVEDSFEQKWNSLIPNNARASRPKEPSPKAAPVSVQADGSNRLSQTETPEVSARSALPKAPPRRKGAAVADSPSDTSPKPAPPEAVRRVDILGGGAGDAAAPTESLQPPVAAAVPAALSAPKVGAHGDIPTEILSSPVPAATASQGAEKLLAHSFSLPEPGVGKDQEQKKEVSPALSPDITSESGRSSGEEVDAEVVPVSESHQDARSFGEGEDIFAAYGSLSTLNTSESGEMDNPNLSANTTSDSFMILEAEDEVHPTQQSMASDEHRTSTPAEGQTSPALELEGSRELQVTPDMGETTGNTTSASYFTARNASSSQGDSAFLTAENTLTEGESTTTGDLPQFSDSTLSVESSVPHATSQYGLLQTNAAITSVEQALFEASQEDEDGAPGRQGTSAPLKSDTEEEVLAFDEMAAGKNLSLEEETESGNHSGAAETLSSDIGSDWEKVSESEEKDAAPTSDATKSKMGESDFLFGVVSLSSSSTDGANIASALDDVAPEHGSFGGGSVGNLEPTANSTESTDFSDLDTADLMSSPLDTSTSLPLHSSGGPTAEPVVSLEESSSPRVASPSAAELSPSSGLSTPSQVGSPRRGHTQKSESSTCTTESDSESDTSSSSSYVCGEPLSSSPPEPSTSRPENLLFGEQDLALATEIYLSRGLTSPRVFDRGPLETIPEDPVDPPAVGSAPSDVSSADIRYEDVFDFEWDDFMGEPLVGRERVSEPSPCQSLDMSDWQLDGDSDSLRSFSNDRTPSQSTRASGGSESASLRSSLGETEVKSGRGRSSRSYVAGLITNRVGGTVTSATYSATNPWRHPTSFYSLYEDFDSDDSWGASETEANPPSESESLESHPSPSGRGLAVDVHANEPELIARRDSAMTSVTTNPSQDAQKASGGKPLETTPKSEDPPGTPSSDLSRSTPAKIVVQDFSAEAPSPDFTHGATPEPSGSLSEPSSLLGLSAEPPLLASTPTSSSDPFSFPLSDTPGQQGTTDPFQNLGTNNPFSGIQSEAGFGEVGEVSESGLSPRDLAAGLLGHAAGDQGTAGVSSLGSASAQQQSLQDSVTGSSLFDFGEAVPRDSDVGSMEPRGQVPQESQVDASSKSEPNPRSAGHDLLGFSSFDVVPEGASSASPGGSLSDKVSQPLAPVQNEVSSGDGHPPAFTSGDLLSGFDILENAAEGRISTGGNPGFASNPSSALLKPSENSKNLLEIGNQLLDQNSHSLDSKTSSDQLPDDPSLLDVDLATSLRARSVHDSPSTVALVDLEEFTSDAQNDRKGDTGRDTMDDLLGL